MTRSTTYIVGRSTRKFDAITARYLGWKKAIEFFSREIKLISPNFDLIHEKSEDSFITRLIKSSLCGIYIFFKIFFKSRKENIFIISSPPFVGAIFACLSCYITKKKIYS
jgi:hypothetical protein